MGKEMKTTKQTRNPQVKQFFYDLGCDPRDFISSSWSSKEWALVGTEVASQVPPYPSQPRICESAVMKSEAEHLQALPPFSTKFSCKF